MIVKLGLDYRQALIIFALSLLTMPAVLGSAVTLGELALFISFITFQRTINFKFSVYIFTLFSVSLAPSFFINVDEVLGFGRFLLFYFSLFLVLNFLLCWKGDLYLLLMNSFCIAVTVHFLFQALQFIYPDLFFINIAPEYRSAVLGGLFYRTSGLLTNPNSLALFYLCVLPLFCASRKWFFVMLSSIGVLLTFSKTMFLAPFIVLYFVFKNFKIVGYVLISIFASLLSYLSYESGVYQYVIDIVNYRLNSADSFNSRFHGLEGKLYDISSDYISLIWGLGFSGDYLNEDLKVHNRYISVFLQFGLVGFCFYLCVILLSCYYALKSRSVPIIMSIFTYLIVINFHTFTYFIVEFLYLIIPYAYYKKYCYLNNKQKTCCVDRSLSIA